MAVDITIDDLRPFAPDISQAKADAMIAGAIARAGLVAPCINDEDFAYLDAVKSILVRAIVRWEDAGAGNTTSVTRGPFGETRTGGRELYWPSEITELQALCISATAGVSGTALPGGYMPDSPLADPWYRSAWDTYRC